MISKSKKKTHLLIGLEVKRSKLLAKMMSTSLVHVLPYKLCHKLHIFCHFIHVLCSNRQLQTDCIQLSQLLCSGYYHKWNICIVIFEAILCIISRQFFDYIFQCLSFFPRRAINKPVMILSMVPSVSGGIIIVSFWAPCMLFMFCGVFWLKLQFCKIL